jgi:hypothetical protein
METFTPKERAAVIREFKSIFKKMKPKELSCAMQLFSLSSGNILLRLDSSNHPELSVDVKFSRNLKKIGFQVIFPRLEESNAYQCCRTRLYELPEVFNKKYLDTFFENFSKFLENPEMSKDRSKEVNLETYPEFGKLVEMIDWI